MAAIFPAGYTLPEGDKPLSHARIAHAGNWIEGAISASSTDAATIYAAEAPANSLLFERWKPAVSPATWEVDPGAATDADYCVIAAHNLGSTGTAVEIEAEIGGVWTSLFTFTPTSDGPIFAIFAPVNATRFRIALSGWSAAPALGFIRFGKALQMEERTRYPGRTPFDLARTVTTTGNLSVRGEFLSRVTLRAGLRLGFQWVHLSEAFTKSEVKAFLDAIEVDLFVIAERPGTHPEDVAVCWTSGGRPRPSAVGAMDLHSLDLTCEGYLSDA